MAIAGSAVGAPPCALPVSDRVWIQRALDGWETTARAHLRLDPEPLPWILVFDTTCVWHLAPDRAVVAGDAQPIATDLEFAGRDVPVRAKPHDGRVPLPNGGSVPLEGLAFASLYDDGARPFFVVALLDVWRLDSAAANTPDLADIILGVVSHEIVHTRQLVLVGRRVEQLQQRFRMPEDINDDIVEDRFREVPEFRELFARETDLLYDAVAQRDSAHRADLVQQALKIVRQRRSRFYVGNDAFYGPLEDLFLNMEGVAVWASYRLDAARHGEAGPNQHQFERARNTWSQDEGLALFLLLEAMVPDWRDHILGSELASPFALLAYAVGVTFEREIEQGVR